MKYFGTLLLTAFELAMFGFAVWFVVMDLIAAYGTRS